MGPSHNPPIQFQLYVLQSAGTLAVITGKLGVWIKACLSPTCTCTCTPITNNNLAQVAPLAPTAGGISTPPWLQVDQVPVLVCLQPGQALTGPNSPASLCPAGRFQLCLRKCSELPLCTAQGAKPSFTAGCACGTCDHSPGSPRAGRAGHTMVSTSVVWQLPCSGCLWPPPVETSLLKGKPAGHQ